MKNKIENQCISCDNMATGEILDFYMIDTLNVCDDCFKDTFTEVANEGKEYFYEWASEYYGEEKANYLCELVFGSGVEEDEKELVTMFTYGILKYPYNIKRERGVDIIENATVSGQVMHLYNNSFPITRMTGNENDVVYGTLFKVPRSTVAQYDYIEGYDSRRDERDNMYNRIIVDVKTPTGEIIQANMYYANQRMFARDLVKHTHIPTGNFDDRALAKSYRLGKKGKK
jgi:gamma-glutamylcyclotransferase (GGCT)/AIG2-like uncharacterized protein YtfP